MAVPDLFSSNFAIGREINGDFQHTVQQSKVNGRHPKNTCIISCYKALI